LTGERTESSAATALAALADPVGPALEPVAAGIEPVVDAIAAVIEALGAVFAAVGFGQVRAMVEAPVDAVTAGVEAVVDAIAAGFPTVGDGAGRVRGSDGRCDEEGGGEGEVGEAAGGGRMAHGRGSGMTAVAVPAITPCHRRALTARW
jgi:hypothetical protein